MPSHDGLEHDLHWPETVSMDWRSEPDPDPDDDGDDDRPAPDYVKAVLGFDPDELWD